MKCEYVYIVILAICGTLMCAERDFLDIVGHKTIDRFGIKTGSLDQKSISSTIAYEFD